MRFVLSINSLCLFTQPPMTQRGNHDIFEYFFYHCRLQGVLQSKWSGHQHWSHQTIKALVLVYKVNIKVKSLIPLQIKIIKSCFAKIRQAQFHQVSWHLSMELFESLISLNSLLLLVQPHSWKKSDNLEIFSQGSLGSAIILCNHDQMIRSPFQKWSVNPPGRNYPLFNNHPYYHF